MNECHGHQNDLECIKCELYNSLTFSWNMLCSKNKKMLDYKIKSQIQAKQDKQENLSKIEKKLLKSIKDNKLNKKKYLKKNDFYYNFYYGINFFTTKSLTVKVYNLDTGNEMINVLTEPNKIYKSPQKFYVRWGIKVYDGKKCIFNYELDLKNKDILIINKSKCLGDNLAFIEAVSSFQQKHQCNITYVIKESFIDLLSFNYPNINFQVKIGRKRYDAAYHLYCGGLGTQYDTVVYDRNTSLERVAENILNVEHKQAKKFKVVKTFDFGGKYVVYSEKASSKMKEWNNSKALKETIKYLQLLGYKVVNLDIKPINKNIPDVIYLNDKFYDLQDKVDIISGAEFFIGLASGLSWLAWCCHKPAIVLGSFSLPICEFDNPYRVFSKDFCFGCWNYIINNCQCIKQGKEYAICNKSITSKMVIETIDKVIADLKNQ